MSKWQNKNYNHPKGSGNKPKHQTANPKVSFKKDSNKSKTDLLFENHKDDMGNEYSLNDIIEIGYPLIETNIDIISSGKPSDILQEVHILLLELINAGLDTKATLSHFLGISENDFILDELFALLENGILSISDDVKYRVTTKGEVFVEQKKFIPVTTQESFTFYIDGLTKEIIAEAPSTTTNTSN